MAKGLYNLHIMVHGGHITIMNLAKVLIDFGLDETVLRNESREPPKKALMSVLQSPWKMKRDDMVRELESYQVVIHPRWNVPELRQTIVEQRELRFPKKEKNPATGLTKMSLKELTETAEELGLTVPPKPTRGLLQKMIRDQVQPPGEQVMTFGKYRSWLFQEVPEVYMDWAVKETKANVNASPDLKLFATWAAEELQRRAERSKAGGYLAVREDPEVKAVITPPDVSSVRSWRSSQSSTPSVKTSEKRALVESDMEEVKAMQADLSEEDAKELMDLETKLAAIRQKNHLPPRGSPQ